MNELKKLKVIFVCGDQSGPHYHDIFIPTLFFKKYDILDCESQHALDYHQLLPADIVHFQRQYAPESFIIMRQLQNMGKPCLFLCDDNVWELPPHNPARGTYEQADIINRYQIIMGIANAVTTSTPWLVNKCKEFNNIVYQFRNLIDPKVYDFVSPGRDDPNEIRIGWTGTPHHHDDAELFDEALYKIINKYQKVKLVFMGYHPPTLFQRYGQGRYEFYHFVPVDAFYPCFASLDIDIGLVPLIDHPFNIAKTIRKFQEFSQLKAPCVVSNIGEYKKLPQDVAVKINPYKPKEWFDSISYLIEEEQERKAMGQRALDYVVENHDINKYIYERAQVYYDVYAAFTKTERIIVWDETQNVNENKKTQSEEKNDLN